MAMKDPQARTKQIIKDDIETIRAYADAFGVEMPDLDENGEVVGLPAPYPREVAGVVRSGYRIYELGQKAVETGMPCLNPILGRNSAEETWKESNDIYKYAEKFGQTVFQFVHSEATRHIDPLKGRELIEQSRGKGGITPKGERERGRKRSSRRQRPQRAPRARRSRRKRPSRTATAAARRSSVTLSAPRRRCAISRPKWRKTPPITRSCSSSARRKTPRRNRSRRFTPSGKRSRNNLRRERRTCRSCLRMSVT